MRLALVTLVVLQVSCAPLIFSRSPVVVDEYPTARVRIYTSGRLCRVEVVMASATLQTAPSRCTLVPHRPTP